MCPKTVKDTVLRVFLAKKLREKNLLSRIFRDLKLASLKSQSKKDGKLDPFPYLKVNFQKTTHKPSRCLAINNNGLSEADNFRNYNSEEKKKSS